MGVQRWAGGLEEFILREVNFEWEVAIPRIRNLEEAPALIGDALEELGLKLERARGPWEVIVIDDVRMPTPN